MQMNIPIAVVGPSHAAGPTQSEPVALHEGASHTKSFSAVLKFFHTASEREGARTERADPMSMPSDEAGSESSETPATISSADEPVPHELIETLPVDWAALLLRRQTSLPPAIAPSHRDNKLEDVVPPIEDVEPSEQRLEDRPEEPEALSVEHLDPAHQDLVLPAGLAAAFSPSEPVQFSVDGEPGVERDLRSTIHTSTVEGRRDVHSKETTTPPAEATTVPSSRAAAVIDDKVLVIPREQMTEVTDPPAFKTGMELSRGDQPAASVHEVAELAVHARQESRIRAQVTDLLSEMPDVLRTDSEGLAVSLAEEASALYRESGSREGEPERSQTSDVDGPSHFHQDSPAPVVGSTEAGAQIGAVARRDGAGSSAPTPDSTSQGNGGIRALQEQEEPVRLPTTPALTVEVNQPDLGTLRVRVAQLDRTIHAHVMTEQADVGRFLTAHEERLDATLQASGLDLGQFHVQVGSQSQHESRQRGAFAPAHDSGEDQRRQDASSKEFDLGGKRERNGQEARILSVLA